MEVDHSEKVQRRRFHGLGLQTRAHQRRYRQDSEHRKVNEEVASRIANSIRANGLWHPIVVRRENVVAFGEREDPRILLVAGRNRLRAAELAGLKEIPAMFFNGDRRHARLITIEENLFRKDLAVLERAEQYAEWFKIAEHLEVSGQDVRKPKAGRPEGGLSKLARELPIAGKTVEARRAGILCRPNN